MQNELVKRLMWSGVLAGVGALSTIVATRIADVFAERPELFVGAAFAGGLVLAQILKRVRR
jgi:hypothetical protein